LRDPRRILCRRVPVAEALVSRPAVSQLHRFHAPHGPAGTRILAGPVPLTPFIALAYPSRSASSCVPIAVPSVPFVINPDHPSLPGHFPGRPVVPGVVLLDHVLALLERRHPELAGVALRLPQVKFLQPLLPGELAAIDLQP